MRPGDVSTFVAPAGGVQDNVPVWIGDDLVRPNGGAPAGATFVGTVVVADATGSYAKAGIALYDPTHGFSYAPVDHWTTIYLRSAGLASDAVNPGATRPLELALEGKDTNDGLTKTSPMLSPELALAKYAHRAIGGERFLFRLAGGLTDAEVLAGVDPWDGQCSSMRQYSVRGLEVGGWEAYVDSFCWEGPAKGVLHAVQPDIGNLEPDPATNGRTRWRLYNAAAYSAGALKGFYLRINRGALMASMELQITGNDGTYLYTDNGNYSNGGGTYSTSTDTFQIVYRAAEFIPTSRPGGVDAGVGGADGIAIQGFGSANMLGRLVNGANPRPTFKWVGFENANVRRAHGVSFYHCYFYHSANFFGSALSFRGCCVDSQVPTVFRDCHVNVEDSALATEVQEYNGHALVEGGPSNPAGNPVHPDVGGQGLYMFSQSAAGGLQIRGGQFNTRKGLSVEGGIVVRDGGRFVMPAPGQAHSVHIRECTGAGTAALHVRDDSLALIEKNNVSFVNVTNHLKVGIGAAIDLGTGSGQFSEAAGWNGNFSRRLEVNGAGKPTGDLSAIRDTATWG